MGFFGAESEEENSPRFHNCADAHRNDMNWHGLGIFECIGIVAACLGGDGFDSRAGGKG